MSDCPRVLVLADPPEAAVLAGLLDLAGCSGVVVNDLFDAVDVLVHHPPEAIVVDLTMPHGDGQALGYWVTDANLDLPLVGVVDIATPAGSLTDGPPCDEILLMPPGVGELARAVANRARARQRDPDRLVLVDEPEPQPPVRVSAVFLPPDGPDFPPEAVDTSDGPRRVLLFGTGSHA